MSEKRLIAIDAETVERVRNLQQRAQEQIAYFIDRGQPYEASFYIKDADSLRSILAAWEEGITSDEAELLSWAAEESAPYLNTEGERRRLRLADRKLIPLLPDPAPQEAE